MAYFIYLFLYLFLSLFIYIQVHGDNIIACSAAEVADRIAVIEGLEEEQKSTAAQRCARIYAECDRKPGKTTVKTFNPVTSERSVGDDWSREKCRIENTKEYKHFRP